MCHVEHAAAEHHRQLQDREEVGGRDHGELLLAAHAGHGAEAALKVQGGGYDDRTWARGGGGRGGIPIG